MVYLSFAHLVNCIQIPTANDRYDFLTPLCTTHKQVIFDESLRLLVRHLSVHLLNIEMDIRTKGLWIHVTVIQKMEITIFVEN